MYLTAPQRSLIERIVNTAETGTPEGDYAAISIYADGPHDIRQITYGRSQTTEYGNLRKLVQMYAAAGGIYSAALAAYADQVGSTPLTNDAKFKKLLKDAGRLDPVMRSIQDRFFEQTYFDPAMQWADDNGFTLPLSGLIIYDSHIHSGGILWLLRNQFPEHTPSHGGDEKTWIREYTQTRHAWLGNHPRPTVRASVYRTQAYLAQIQANNWDLSKIPVNMNGTAVSPI